ncbi:unnamed protein product [Ixodes pacificus]
MPFHCCVPLCKQRGVRDDHGDKVSFFAFPRNPVLRKKWLIAIKRDEGKHFTISKFTKVCSRHFQEKDYLSNIACGHRFLKQDIVPSVFAFNVAKRPPRKASFQRTPPTRKIPTAKKDATDYTSANGVASETSASATTLNESVDTATQAEVIKNLQIQLNRCKDQLTQTEDTLHHAQAELQAALAKCSSLQKHEAELKETKHALRRFCIDCFKDSPADVLFCTGLLSHDHFMRLLSFLDPGEDGENVKVWSTTYSDKARKAGRRSILSSAEQLFLLLVRLRLGLFERDLAYRFQVSKATVSKVCITWISYVYVHLGQLHLWLPREAVDDAMPPAFKDRYPTTRVILDATEVKCEASSSLVLQSATFFPYKSTNTFKGLIGISPDGTVTFISELFTGSMSDKECVEKSGFLKLPFDDGDSVMADKGFRIEEMLKKINVQLNIPPFLRKGHFTTEEVKETEQIASLRIHVERRIQRIKNFHIYDRPVPISLAPVVSEMWAICVVLTNFQSPLMKASND